MEHPVIVVTNEPPGDPEAGTVYLAPFSTATGLRASGCRVAVDVERTTELHDWLVAEVESRVSAA